MVFLTFLAVLRLWKRVYSFNSKEAMYTSHVCTCLHIASLNLRSRPHYAGGIQNRNNHQLFWICVIDQNSIREITHEDYRDVIVSEKLRFQNVFGPRKNESQRFQILPVPLL